MEMERPNKRQRSSPCTDDSASIVLHSAEHSQGLLDRLNSQRERGILCDVTLRVGGEDFSAHRVVLAAASDFLQALLTGGWRESNEEVIRLDGIDAACFRALLHFIYSGELCADDVDSLLQLLVASEHLGLSTVRPICVERLQQRLDLPNALKMRLFAQQVGCAELESAASDVVWGQFTQVVMAGNGFLDLEPSQLEELLMSDKLAVDSEDEVYYALLRWVRHNPDQRRQHLAKLLTHIRVALLPPAILDAMEQDDPAAQVIRDNDLLRNMIATARRMHMDASPALLSASSTDLPAPTATESLSAAAAASDAPQLDATAAADIAATVGASRDADAAAQTPHPMALDTEFAAHGDAPASNRPLQPDLQLTSAIRSDSAPSSPTAPAPTSQAPAGQGGVTGAQRLCADHDGGGAASAAAAAGVPAPDGGGGAIAAAAAAAAASVPAVSAAWGGGDGSCVQLQLVTRARERRVHRALYACGGKPAWTRVERFDPRAGEWGEASPMLSRRMRHGAATVGGLVYVVGGKDEEGRVLATAERYDAHADAWERVAPMRTARTGVAVGALHGKLYAVGGRHESGHRLKTAECYNAQTGTWSPIAPMATARSAARVAALGDRLFVVGGRSDVSPAVASVEAYDPRLDRWLPVAQMRTARVGAGVEAVGGRLFAVGGKDAAGNKLRSVERYDPARDTWEEVASMGTKRWGAGVGVLDGLLYVLGGMNGAERGAIPTVELYDPVRDVWTELVPGPSLARGSCTFTPA